MANGNSGCGTLLVGLAAIWMIGQCVDSSSPPPSYEPPAVTQAYSPPPPDYEASPPLYADESDVYVDTIDDAGVDLDETLRDTYADEPGLSNDNYYTNSRGETVHSPAYSLDDTVPAGASARCRDGTYSFSRSRRGTCSHHGGVDHWL